MLKFVFKFAEMNGKRAAIGRRLVKWTKCLGRGKRKKQKNVSKKKIPPVLSLDKGGEMLYNQDVF